MTFDGAILLPGNGHLELSPLPALYDLVLIAQPATYLQNRAAVERTPGATDGAYTEVVRCRRATCY